MANRASRPAQKNLSQTNIKAWNSRDSKCRVGWYVALRVFMRSSPHSERPFFGFKKVPLGQTLTEIEMLEIFVMRIFLNYPFHYWEHINKIVSVTY